MSNIMPIPLSNIMFFIFSKNRKHSYDITNFHIDKQHTAALRFSLPFSLAGCRLLFHFIFVLFLFLIACRILEQ